MEKTNFLKDNPNYENSDEIDLKDLFVFYLRNRLLIGSITIVFILLSIIYSAFKKNIWEGRFQIVLDPQPVNQIPNNLLTNMNIPGFSGLNMSSSSSLPTEVTILKSPFVLMPAFDFVMDEKNQNKENSFNYNFSEWKKNLIVELERGTTVLNISYRDEDKSIIKPVLTNISKIYQDYSGQTKKRKFSLADDYLKKQISIFKIKSFKSIKNAQQYAIEQDLRIIDLNNNLNQIKVMPEYSELSSSVLSNIGIENVRVSAANKIRNIDIQISQIEELNDDVKQLQYIGSTIPGLVKEGLPQILENIETDLIELRSKYTEKDKLIIRLLQKRDLYVNLLKERAIGYLRAERLSTEALMLSAMRPKGVLLKYKELIREANRDENMLIELENQLKILNLEKARTEDPWKLITKPTLKEDPVAPNRISIILFGLIFGLASGSLLTFMKEKLK